MTRSSAISAWIGRHHSTWKSSQSAILINNYWSERRYRAAAPGGATKGVESMVEQREWVRNHRIAGFVVGRFRGEFEGEQRDLIALQTMDGIRVVPEGSVLPVDMDYMIRQTALDLERVIEGILEGGFTPEQAEAAWQRAMALPRIALGRAARD